MVKALVSVLVMAFDAQSMEKVPKDVEYETEHHFPSLRLMDPRFGKIVEAARQSELLVLRAVPEGPLLDMLTFANQRQISPCGLCGDGKSEYHKWTLTAVKEHLKSPLHSFGYRWEPHFHPLDSSMFTNAVDWVKKTQEPLRWLTLFGDSTLKIAKLVHGRLRYTWTGYDHTFLETSVKHPEAIKTLIIKQPKDCCSQRSVAWEFKIPVEDLPFLVKEDIENWKMVLVDIGSSLEPLDLPRTRYCSICPTIGTSYSVMWETPIPMRTVGVAMSTFNFYFAFAKGKRGEKPLIHGTFTPCTILVRQEIVDDEIQEQLMEVQKSIDLTERQNIPCLTETYGPGAIGLQCAQDNDGGAEEADIEGQRRMRRFGTKYYPGCYETALRDRYREVREKQSPRFVADEWTNERRLATDAQRLLPRGKRGSKGGKGVHKWRRVDTEDQHLGEYPNPQKGTNFLPKELINDDLWTDIPLRYQTLATIQIRDLTLQDSMEHMDTRSRSFKILYPERSPENPEMLRFVSTAEILWLTGSSVEIRQCNQGQETFTYVARVVDQKPSPMDHALVDITVQCIAGRKEAKFQAVQNHSIWSGTIQMRRSLTQLCMDTLKSFIKAQRIASRAKESGQDSIVVTYGQLKDLAMAITMDEAHFRLTCQEMLGEQAKLAWLIPAVQAAKEMPIVDPSDNEMEFDENNTRYFLLDLALPHSDYSKTPVMAVEDPSAFSKEAQKVLLNMLNRKQRQIIGYWLKNPRCTIPVVGPPGTGKSFAIAVYLLYMALDNDSHNNGPALGVTQSNAAADSLTRRLAHIKDAVGTQLNARFPNNDFEKEISITRQLSQEHSIIYQEIKGVNHLVSSSVPKNLWEKQGHIVIMTVAMAVTKLATNYGLMLESVRTGQSPVRCIVLDEGGCGLLHQFIPIMKLARLDTPIILIGDPLQLRPVLREPFLQQLGLSESSLETVMRIWLPQLPEAADYIDSIGVAYNDLLVPSHIRILLDQGRQLTLEVNYRSLRCLFGPSNPLYGGILKAEPGVQSRWWKYLEAKEQKALRVLLPGLQNNQPSTITFIGVQDKREWLGLMTGNSPYSVAELEVATNVAEMLLSAGIPLNHMGFASPYKAVTKILKPLLLKRLGDPYQVKTVTAWQGDEAPVVITLAGVSRLNPGLSVQRHPLGFTGSVTRSNVALTRAKAAHIVIGDIFLLLHQPTFQHELIKAYQEGRIIGTVSYAAQVILSSYSWSTTLNPITPFPGGCL